LQKEVIPRLSNAHNFSNGLPVYRFLCDLQSQGMGIIPPWSWSVFSKEPFLPRIEYKKIILQRARWYLRQRDFLQQKKKAANFELVRYFRAFQNQWAIPPLVVLHEGDNELLIDFDSSLSLAILAETLEKKDVEIYEYLSTPNNCFIKQGSGSYANEVIIPLSCRHPVTGPAIPAPQRQASPPPVKRVFLTGSEWLYVKLYTGSKTADKLISSLLLPLTKKLLREGIIESWFYIRYQDPDVHLRIRFHHGNRAGFWAEVVAQLQELLQPFVAQGLVSKLVIDTYEREIERYGQHTIHLSEALFASDSSAIAEFISALKGDQGEQHRWLFALKSIDQLLNDFNYSLQHKYDLLTFLQTAFYEEHEKLGLYDKLLYRLNNKYRAVAAQISALLSHQQASSEIDELLACFTRRSARNVQICQKIKDALQLAPDKDTVLQSLLSSYIHMSLNRIFITKQRLHELVIYHYLAKYYDSQLARNP
jgi:thiopeptide-type bacteriocin biosynthesis protein